MSRARFLSTRGPCPSLGFAAVRNRHSYCGASRHVDSLHQNVLINCLAQAILAQYT
jgi:hypothetical protein